MNVPYFPLAAARGLILLAILASAPGCALLGRSENPFLRAGPIGPRPGYTAGPPLDVADYLAAEPGIPAGFTASDGLRPLPGAEIPGIGPVRALVVSLSLGGQQPQFDERRLEQLLFGADFTTPGTVAHELYEASGGKLRFSAGVLPTLIDTRPLGRLSAPAPQDLERLARQALATWGRDTSLVEFDDDGPDGIPYSVDDDGRVDLLFLTVESEARFASQTVRGDFTIDSPYGRVRVGNVHVVWVPRRGALDAGPAIGLTLGALGLDEGERYFPAGYPRGISSVARARLGWLPIRALLESGSLELSRAEGVAVPLHGLVTGAGIWLVESAGDQVYTSRLGRKSDGHYQVTALDRRAEGSEQILALSRQLGLEGPRVYVSWPRGERSAFVELLREGGSRPEPIAGEEYLPVPVSRREDGPGSATVDVSRDGVVSARDLSACDDGLPLVGVPAACYYAVMNARVAGR